MLKKLLIGLLIVVLGIAGALVINRPPVEPPVVEQVQSLPDAVEAILDSCVHVVNVTQSWQGSAFAITSDILVTARHVVEGGEECLSYCVPLDVAVPDLSVIRLLFVEDEYEVEIAIIEQSWEDSLIEIFEDFPGVQLPLIKETSG